MASNNKSGVNLEHRVMVKADERVKTLTEHITKKDKLISRLQMDNNDNIANIVSLKNKLAQFEKHYRQFPPPDEIL